MKYLIIALGSLFFSVFCYRGWRRERGNVHLALRDAFGTVVFALAFVILLGLWVRGTFFDQTIVSEFFCQQHPIIIQPTEGLCPICNQKLKARRRKLLSAPNSATIAPTGQEAKQVSLYRCEQHAEVILPFSGECPKCNAPLVLHTNVVIGPPDDGDPIKGVYTCPMHPQVEMRQSGKCPQCGMYLRLMSTDEI